MGIVLSNLIFNYEKLGRNADLELLKMDDISMIKQSWSIVKNNPDLGILVMIRIFTAHKSIRHVWIFASELETEQEMRSNSQLRYHAKRIIDTIGTIIDQLDTNISRHKKFLINMGVQHYHYGVKCTYFKDFLESMLYVLETVINDKEIFNRSTKAAWRKLILLIADNISYGIRTGEEKKFKEQNNKPVR